MRPSPDDAAATRADASEAREYEGKSRCDWPGHGRAAAAQAESCGSHAPRLCLPARSGGRPYQRNAHSHGYSHPRTSGHILPGRCDNETAAIKSDRSEEHTSELPSLMRISYAVFCLKKKNKHNNKN